MPKKLSLALLVVFFTAILVFANSKGFLVNAQKSFYDITAPTGVFFSENANSVSRFFGGLFTLGKLQKENAFLKDQVNRLQADVAQLSEAKKENESLKKDLNFTKDNKFAYEAAEVISFDPAMLRGTIVINKGKKNGLKAGMAAISEGFLVGRISEVADNTAKIQLITDPLSAIPATLQNASTSGIARGEIGYGLAFEKIPQGNQIGEGDIVISSGLGGEIPKGLILGKVEKVERKDNSLFLSASIRPSAGLRNLYRLIIIKN
jgi:rod shape-determining protein MreC